MAWRLFVRDVSAKYRQSILGIFWAFLPPIVSGMVFIILQSRGIVNVGKTDIPYPVFVLVGTILWQVFSESLQAPLQAVQAAKPMLAKINFPREALIVSAFYQLFLNLLIKSAVIVGVLVLFRVRLHWTVLLAPIPITMLIMLGIAIGLLLTPIGMLYSDVGSALSLASHAWFFVTPVVYPPPTSFPLSLITVFNPVSPLIIGARDLLTKGVLHNVQPFLIVSGLAILALLAAWLIYRVALPIIVERMSS